MIDLKTCGRPEFIAAYEILESSYNQLKEENHALNERLQAYEGVEEDINEEFEKRWSLYGRKGNKQTSLARFKRLTKPQIKAIDSHLPRYVESTPERKYRKNFEVYISRKCWLDEIEEEKPKRTKRSHRSFKPYKAPDENHLRQANKDIDIKKRLGLK